MRQGRPGAKIKNKQEKTSYTITITGEQIKLIRSLELRIDQTWVHTCVSEALDENNRVDRIPIWECYYCQCGSYENASAIKHSGDCIIPLVNQEFGALNEQFIQVERQTQEVSV